MTQLPDFFTLYRTLIAIPTVSSDDTNLDNPNLPLIEALSSWFETLGFEITISKVPESRDKYNLLASIYPKNGVTQGGLLLTGHTDTVPFDQGRWTQDPFKLTERENKLYGLGTADMKGFFAFILDALSQIDLSKITKPLHILATADEESTMAGARYFAANALIRPDFAIIGEPTSLEPIRAHKGHVAHALKIIGQSGHSSNPALGVNAIDLMHESIGHLIELRESLKTRYQNASFTVPHPTMNFGYINGGDAANRICACCELHLDIRPLPGLSLDELNGLVTDALKPVTDKYPGRLNIQEMHASIPGYECPTDHHLVKEIEKLLAKRTDVVNYCTEAPFIQSLCPTLVLGPGSIDQAHQPDEFIDMSFIEPTRKVLTQLIQFFCLNETYQTN
ncbi:acetylornithine deacetylase [Thorsellia anophelis]|uniref:Acetylornithine deacetylase n=1 Tax=Thorsellia anophelis DSM 18579 TaxID=1123402 RepID=A0A1H9Z8U2_9GAMM|nr:acetylornithine deacetylase [Thorsellia anophelis]SES77904.1 acetylornithine deacetylase [Thorsellia anophelis DSM 18579]